MVRNFNLTFLLCLFVLGACASKMKDEMKVYREYYGTGEFSEADKALQKSELKKDKKSQLLWLLETGTLSLAQGNEKTAIQQFQSALEMIDQLYTKKISAKAASFLINDASDIFYGSNYERSYAHYFLAKAYYQLYLKENNIQHLQAARATILAWDSYFSELKRSAAPKTIYQTDLMLKVFGAQIHEVSEIRNDKQIALQLYRDAVGILETMGGAFEVFNSKAPDFIKSYEEILEKGGHQEAKNFAPTAARDDLRNFIVFKILHLTKEIRPQEFAQRTKELAPEENILKKVNGPKSNVVLLLEEGLIPQKVGKTFNFGLKGAIDSVDNPGAKAFIATVGAEIVTAFAMNTLGMRPENFQSTGGFIFAHDVTRLAVQEAAISFELPAIEKVPPVENLDFVIKDSQGKIVQQGPLAIVSENGSLARVVLEEDIVSHYVKTGTRVAVKHLVAIVAAMQVYQNLKPKGDFLAKSMAMATYIASSKGIAAFERADVRHWTTLPKTFRMSEISLAPGLYEVGVSQRGVKEPRYKNLGNIQVKESGKTIHNFKFITL